jgi:hypothetical protein
MTGASSIRFMRWAARAEPSHFEGIVRRPACEQETNSSSVHASGRGGARCLMPTSPNERHRNCTDVAARKLLPIVGPAARVKVLNRAAI